MAPFLVDSYALQRSRARERPRTRDAGRPRRHRPRRSRDPARAASPSRDGRGRLSGLGRPSRQTGRHQGFRDRRDDVRGARCDDEDPAIRSHPRWRGCRRAAAGLGRGQSLPQGTSACDGGSCPLAAAGHPVREQGTVRRPVRRAADRAAGRDKTALSLDHRQRSKPKTRRPWPSCATTAQTSSLPETTPQPRCWTAVGPVYDELAKDANDGVDVASGSLR